MTETNNDRPVDSVLPNNSGRLERGIERAGVELDRRHRLPLPILLQSQGSPAQQLPYLAAERGVTDWDAAASETEQRAICARIWPQRRQAGMRAGLRHAVEALGLELELIPWHRMTPQGAPYDLEIRVGVLDRLLTPELSERLDRRISEALSERDNPTISLHRQALATPRIGVSTELGVTITAEPFVPSAAESTAAPVTGAAFYIHTVLTAEPAAL